MSTPGAHSTPGVHDTPETVTQQPAAPAPYVYGDNHERGEQDMSAQAIDMEPTESDNRWKRGFWSVWATQFQESFSENAYRWIVLSFVINMVTRGVSTSETLVG